MVIPLSGPNSQFDKFMEILINQFSIDTVEVFNLSGDNEDVIAIGIVGFEFFRL